MSFEKIEWEQAALETITRTAGGHKVARVVGPAAGQWHNVVKRGAVLIKARGAVHTPLTAIAQRGATHRLFRGHVGRQLWPQ